MISLRRAMSPLGGSMRVLVVQNYENTALGQIGRALEEAGATIEVVDAHLGATLPEDASGHDALVVLGGGQNALDDELYPYLPSLLELMRGFAAADKAVLGVCLGSQLLARAFGAANHIGTATEFGWCAVRLTGEGTIDPVLRHLPKDFRPFQWHDDTFSLPAGAIHLASSDTAANQAFRIGRAVYGLQFHFEADRKVVRDWSGAFADVIAERQPAWSGRFEAEEAAHGAAADRHGLEIARAWVATI